MFAGIDKLTHPVDLASKELSALVESLESIYAFEYAEIARIAVKKYGDIEEAELYKIIQSKSSIPTIRRVE